MYVFKSEFSLPSDKFHRVELLNHMGAFVLIVRETSILFFIASVPMYTPTNGLQGFFFVCVLANICYFLFFFFLILVFLLIAILTGVRWYLMKLQIYVSVITDVEHLFTYLWAICISSLEKCLFISAVHFFKPQQCFLLLLKFINSLYSLDISPLSDV